MDRRTATRSKINVVWFAIVAAAIIAAACLAGCSGTGSTQKTADLKQQSYPFVMPDSDVGSTDEKNLNLYFFNGSDIPYVSVSEFMPLFGDLYKDDSGEMPAAEYDIAQAGSVMTVTRTDSGAQMAIDADADTISFSDLDLFVKYPGDASLLDFVPIGSTGIGGVSNLFKVAGETYDRTGAPVELDLAAYTIDIIESDGGCYLPLQTASDVLVGRLEGRMMFNGEKVFLIGSETNDLQDYYSAPTGQMSDDFAAFNYNELRFALDAFYGLMPQHNIGDFETLFESTGLKEGLASTDPTEFDSALKTLISIYIDDLHSSYQSPSYLSGTGSADNAAASSNSQDEPDITDLLMGEPLVVGESTLNMTKDMLAYGYYRKQAYSDTDLSNGVFLYEEVDDTAIITFDTFVISKDDYYKDADLDNPQDTIELIAAAHKRITREGSPIKNVVIDLSNNGGGQTMAAAFLIAWCKGPTPLATRNELSGAQSAASYYADVNLDGTFDKSDILPVDIKVYCLTSPVSFSCGNLVPAVFKGSPRISLIGRASGGGTCTVLACSSASGALFCISGPKQISTIKNGSFYNVDQGIDPDFGIDKVETFYDRQQLVNFIHSLW